MRGHSAGVHPMIQEPPILKSGECKLSINSTFKSHENKTEQELDDMQINGVEAHIPSV